jgi:hypothetical protein
VKEVLWVYHIETKDHLCERAPLALWVYHIEMNDHLCERAPLDIFSGKELLWVSTVARLRATS